MTNEERAEWLVKYWDITDSGKRLIYKDDILKHLNAACDEAVKAEREKLVKMLVTYYEKDADAMFIYKYLEQAIEECKDD